MRKFRRNRQIPWFGSNFRIDREITPKLYNSHWYEYESGYPCAGYSKHEFACIPVAAVHTDISSVGAQFALMWVVYIQYIHSEWGNRHTHEFITSQIRSKVLLRQRLISRADTETGQTPSTKTSRSWTLPWKNLKTWQQIKQDGINVWPKGARWTKV